MYDPYPVSKKKQLVDDGEIAGWPEQPAPRPSKGKIVADEVIKDMEARKRLGIAKYKVALQPNNGRDALQDAYEEALDLCMYLKQEMMQRES